jgi:hypothetical protein
MDPKRSDVEAQAGCGYPCEVERGYNCQTIKGAMAKGTRISISLGMFVLLAASLLGPPPAGAQSLAEAARKEKERRANVQDAGPAKSYSTEDLASFHVDRPATEAKPDAASKTDTEDALRAEETARASQKAYWRQRSAGARQAVQDAERHVAMYFKPSQPSKTSRSLKYSTIQLGHGLEDFTPEGRRLRASLAMARQGLDLLEDEARRAGVPPGWVR